MRISDWCSDVCPSDLLLATESVVSEDGPKNVKRLARHTGAYTTSGMLANRRSAAGPTGGRRTPNRPALAFRKAVSSSATTSAGLPHGREHRHPGRPRRAGELSAAAARQSAMGDRLRHRQERKNDGEEKGVEVREE